MLCFANFQGEFCEIPITGSCDCRNGGICVGNQCLCPAGYVGSQCQMVDPCSGEWITYHKIPKKSVNNSVIILEIEPMWIYRRVMCPNNKDGMANSVDSNQTAPSDLGLHFHTNLSV